MTMMISSSIGRGTVTRTTLPTLLTPLEMINSMLSQVAARPANTGQRMEPSRPGPEERIRNESMKKDSAFVPQARFRE
jgi:hypothetical protein